MTIVECPLASQRSTRTQDKRRSSTRPPPHISFLLEWLNWELYALLAIKTSDTAMASIKSLEEVEAKGIIGWQRLEREARGYHRHRVAVLTESVTHPERVLKVTDLQQAFYRCEGQCSETLDAEGKPGCCGLAAAVPHFFRDSRLHVATSATAS